MQALIHTSEHSYSSKSLFSYSVSVSSCNPRVCMNELSVLETSLHVYTLHFQEDIRLAVILTMLQLRCLGTTSMLASNPE